MVFARSAAPTELMAHPAPNLARPPPNALPALSPFSALWPMASAAPWALSIGRIHATPSPPAAMARFSAALVTAPATARWVGLRPLWAAAVSCCPRS